jgi:hypothetical protein
VGDQAGLALYTPLNVRRRSSPVSRSLIQTCGLPLRSETKAIWRPSGENVGEVSIERSSVMRSGFEPLVVTE